MSFCNLPLGKGAALAPMAGVTDIAMRKLCARFGAIYTVSEMASAKAIVMGDKKSPKLLRGGGGDKPYGIQLFGANAQDMHDAICLVNQMGFAFDFIDINMGCPAPKITSSGAGCALLKNPQLAQDIAKAAVSAAKVPVTVKIRLGFDMDNLTGLEVAQRCESVGVSAVTVHARTRQEMYNPGVHLDLLANIKKALTIPVIANGDVTDGESAIYTLSQTGCDGLMVGRAAMGNPWLFDEIKAALCGEDMPPKPSLSARFAIMREHIEKMCDDKGERIAMNEARSHCAWYMYGLKGAAQLRRECSALSSFVDVDYLIRTAMDLQR